MTETNGPAEGQKYIDTIDPEDPEYIRQMRRPAEVKEDVKQMEGRKRVSMIMKTQAFREELEQIVNEQLSSGSHPASLLALQQISNLVLPNYRFNQTTGVTGGASGTIIPIADIRGVDSLNYSKGEKIMRCKVASAYRLVDLNGWSRGISSLVTVRITQDYEHFLVAPYGLLYHEITASSLLKVDMQGEVVDQGSTIFPLNKNNFNLHAAVHAFRPDVKAIIHLTTPAAIAISSMKNGLLPISQEAVLVGQCSYFDYQGSLIDQDEKDKLARTLGPNNKILFLINNGILACGESVEEAFYNANNLMAACDSQLKVAHINKDDLNLPSEETMRRMYEAAQIGGGGDAQERRKWRKGEVEFEAQMRHLDNCGFRTGYIYHEPNIRKEQRGNRANEDVEIPPSTSSFQYMYDDDKFSSPLKAQFEYQKKHSRTEWLNTPNVYKKEEVEETGTPNPKKVTKWVPDKDNQATPVKLTNSNQFAPQGADPKELTRKHKDIRKDYYEERITAGPQSRILEGMSWEEAQQIKDGHVSGTADSMIVVGAASKGIIMRDHQTNVGSYRQYYTPNPFDNMSEQEIERYKHDIEKKSGSRDLTSEEELEPAPDGKLISTQQRMQQVRQPDSVEVQGHAYPAPQYVDAQVDIVEHRPPPPIPPRGGSRLGDKAVNGDDQPQQLQSPTKSTSSGEATLEEGSPTKEGPSSSPEKKGKKKKFRIPSFSKKKEKEKK